MLGVILALLILPLAASLAAAVLPWPAKVGPAVTGTSGVASFGLILALVAAAAHHDLDYLSYLRVDALSVIFLLTTGFLYGAVGVYSIGYLKHHGHTWLPDAHSEAPTPVSALLSGSLLAVSFYAILRFYQFTAAALGTGFPRDALLVFGVASLLLAALYVFGQRDIKRLLAYSSVEHMGILAIGVSFGAPAALAGVMLHVLAHAAAKGNAFMGAGVFTVKYRTKQISTMRGALDLLPWSGPLFLLAIFALSAMPPSGIFRSEFQIVAGGLSGGHYAAAAVLVVLITVAFFGLTTASTRILFTPAPRSLSAAVAADRGEPSAWMVVPAVAGVAVLFLLGLHPPGELTGLISRAVTELGAPR